MNAKCSGLARWPSFTSPEQCLGKAVDARADVYAVGVLLWEALARRRRAFGDQNDLQALEPARQQHRRSQAQGAYSVIL